MIMKLADRIDDQVQRSDLQLSGLVIMKTYSDLQLSGRMINTGQYMINFRYRPEVDLETGSDRKDAGQRLPVA